MDQKSFILYHDMWEQLSELSDEEIGKITRATFIYHATGKIIDIWRLCNIVFKNIKTMLDRDRNKYDEYIEKQSENGKKGGRPKKSDSNPTKPKKPTAFFENPTKPKKADSASVPVSLSTSPSGIVIDNTETDISKDIWQQAFDPVEKKEYWNKDINAMLWLLKKLVWCTTFSESEQWQRNYAKHMLTLWSKIGKEEFMRRLEWILSDSFKLKNCNKLKYLYKEMKAYIHSPVVPQNTKNSVFILS